MFRHTNQSKEDKKNTVEKKENVALDLLRSADVVQIISSLDQRKLFIDEKFISKNVISPTRNKFFDMFSIPFKACKHLSISNLSTLKNVWPELNSGQSVKPLPLGEISKNVSDYDINKKESLLDRINKIKDKVDSENEDNKLQTDFYNDQNLFEK